MTSIIQVSKDPNIHNLPNETLLEIFSYHPVGRDIDCFCSAKGKTWLSISHVCQRWRDLFVNTPSFWKFIVTQNAFWTRVCLSRSTGEPISTQLTHCRRHEYGERTVDLLFPHLPRMKKLAIGGRSMSSKDYRKEYAPSLRLYTADTLEELSVYAPKDRRMVVRIDDAIFRGHAPKLQKLSLSGEALHISWNNHLFSANLSYLSLQNFWNIRPSFPQLLSLLERSSVTLTHLKLCDVLCSAEVTLGSQISSFNDHRGRRVSFPQLEVLDVSDRALSVARLLWNFDVPSRALKRLNLSVDSYTSNEIIGQAYSIVLPKLFIPASTTASSTMHIVNSDNKLYWKIEPPRDEIHPGQVDDEHTGRPTSWTHHKLRIKFSSHRDISETFTTITTSVPVCSSLHSLHLELGPHVPVSSWTKLFGDFVTVSRLTLGGSTASSFLSALADVGPQALPRLRAINIKFPHDSPQDCHIALVGPLRVVLSWRRHDTADLYSQTVPEPTAATDTLTKQAGIKLVLVSCPRASEMVAQLDAISAHPIEVV